MDRLGTTTFREADFRDLDRLIPTPTVPLLDGSLAYSPDLEVLMCTLCLTNVKANGPLEHLRRKHRAAWERVSLHPGVAECQRQLAELRLEGSAEAIAARLSHGALFFAELRVLVGNFKCSLCELVSTSRKSVRVHYGRVHQQQQPTTRRAAYVVDGVPLQVISGFPNNRKLYFIPKLPSMLQAPAIAAADPPARATAQKATDVPDDVRARVVADYYRSIEQADGGDGGAVDENARLQDSFAQHSAIFRFLAGRDRNALVALAGAAPADGSDAVLDALDARVNQAALKAAVVAVLQAASEAIPNIPVEVLQRLNANTRNTKDRVYKKLIPLERKAQREYFGLFAGLTRFLYRLAALQDPTLEQLEGCARYSEAVDRVALPPNILAALNEIARSLELGSKPDAQSAVEAGLCDVWAGLLEIPLGSSFLENGAFHNPAVVFFYCCCLGRDSGRVKEVGVLSRYLSMLIYDTKIATAARFLAAERKGGAFDLKRLEAFVDAYLTNSSNNCFEFFSMLRPYAIALAKETANDRFQISGRGATLRYQGVEYPLDRIRALFRDLYARIQRLLLTDILDVGSVDSIGIPFARLYDSAAGSAIGESIADLPELDRFRRPPLFLTRLTTAGTKMNAELVAGTTSVGIALDPAGVATYVDMFDELALLIAAGIHLFSGSPMRGTELGLILYRNTEEKRRSLAFDNERGAFAVYTTYYKSRNITRRDRLTLRTLPPYLSKLLVVYIVLALPLRDYLYREGLGETGRPSPFLLAKGLEPLSPGALSAKLNSLTLGYFDRGLTLSHYRRVINYIIKTELGGQVDEMDTDESEPEDLIEDRQANRSTKVSYQYYIGVGASLGLRGAATLDELRQAFEFCKRYAAFFGIAGVDEPTSRAPRAGGPDRSGDTLEQGVRDALRALLRRDDAEFRDPDQRTALLAAARRPPVLTYINRTGGGKSLLYLVPALKDGGSVHIVLTPRTSLTQDLTRRAKALGLNATARLDSVSAGTNMYFVDVEALDTIALDRTVGLHRSLGRRVTIYVDEVHLFAIERSFRHALKHFPQILRYSAPIVLLSATLPEMLLLSIERTLGIRHCNEVVRGSARRGDVRYERVQRPTGTDDERASAVGGVLDDIRRRGATKKTMVFVGTRATGAAIGAALGLPFVSSDTEGKEALLADFRRDGGPATLVCTSVAEVGLDYDCVGQTVHVEPVWGLLSFVQSSGRIRGSGTAYLICRARTAREVEAIAQRVLDTTQQPTDAAFKALDRGFFQRLAVERDCLRTPIGLFLDGEAYRCAPGDAECSVCEERSRLLGEVAGRSVASSKRYRANLAEVDAVVRKLFQETCILCLFDPTTPGSRYRHSYSDCPRAYASARFLGAVASVKSSIAASQDRLRNHACYSCLLPLVVCRSLAEAQSFDDGDCYIGDYCAMVIAALAVHCPPAVLHPQTYRQSPSDLARHLIQTSTYAGLDAILLIEVLRNLDVRAVLEARRDVSSGPKRPRASTLLQTAEEEARGRIQRARQS